MPNGQDRAKEIPCLRVERRGRWNGLKGLPSAVKVWCTPQKKELPTGVRRLRFNLRRWNLAKTPKVLLDPSTTVLIIGTEGDLDLNQPT